MIVSNTVLLVYCYVVLNFSTGNYPAKLDARKGIQLLKPMPLILHTGLHSE